MTFDRAREDVPLQISWLDRAQETLADTLARRMVSRAGSVFRLVGIEVCQRLTRATLAAFQADLVAERREALRQVFSELVVSLTPQGLSFADLRTYCQSLRALVLEVVDGAPELTPAERRRVEDWLMEAVLVSTTNFFARHAETEQERAVAAEVRQLETQLGVLKELNDSLEERVRERTADLAAKNAALAAALSDLQRTQQQLIHAEKMASLGLLVAGIAHEIKNPLNFVNNFAELSLEFIDELERLAKNCAATEQGAALAEILPELADNLRRIHEHGRRADTIINAMSMHAREPAHGTLSADLNELVRTHAALAYQGFRASDRAFRLEIVEDFDRDLIAVPVASQELSRVVLNLVTNACYALRERQRGADPDYRPRLRLTTRRRDELVEIRVADNGPGIPEEIRGRIFDPFFTTKPPGEGTGLGLSMCYDIVVKNLGGQIALTSTTGECSEFTITLPGGRR